jgi:hypothetical protein
MYFTEVYTLQSMKLNANAALGTVISSSISILLLLPGAELPS